MVFELGFPCIHPPHLKTHGNEEQNDENLNHNSDLEHNRTWLLAETSSSNCAELGNGSNADPRSTNSSFRLNFSSYVDFGSFSMNPLSAATVLMVDLEDGLVNEEKSDELKSSKMASLERSITPSSSYLIRFNYHEIRGATLNFSEGRVLGKGPLSKVFKGRIGFSRKAVAIKWLNKDDKDSPKVFCKELMIASSLNNPNIVPLLGFSINHEEGLFLVYKYVSGGSLENHLHEKTRGVKGSSILTWPIRYKVAMGVAQAVSYLRNSTERCVVHRDIKPSNILLSSKKVPKLCDFALATWTSAPSVPFLCKTVKGTFGYLAPEYFQHGKVSDKTDVYAFGVVLLELITGRKPIDTSRPPGEENLVLWAKPRLIKGRVEIDEIIDPRVKRRTKFSNQIDRMIQAAVACVTSDESQRPSIDEIIHILIGQVQHISSAIKRSKLSNVRHCLNGNK